MANKLGVSEFSDAILTAELRHPELVLIGTYGDQLMFYGRDDLLTVVCRLKYWNKCDVY
jgi:hypothetical protein